MGWTHIPNMDTAASTSDDKPFAGPKTQPAGKVKVKMPIDEWLCKKMAKHLWKATPHIVRKLAICSKTSLFVQPDLSQSGMALFPTIRRVTLELLKLCHHGVLTLVK